jgi:prepilin-type N-terminal cleavage/methylation domain-containing protein
MDKKNQNKGFTLIELIIVIALIAILAMIAIPSFLDFTSRAKESTDIINLRELNTMTAMYRLSENITSDDVFEGFITDQERMQSLVNSGLLIDNIEPQQKEISFKWDINQQTWVYGNLSYNIILTPQELSSTVDEAYRAFVNFTEIWMAEESKIPITNSSNGSLSWSSANYTGTSSTNLFTAKFWNSYFEYVDVPDFNASNSSISDFKVFYERDEIGNITSSVAGVYIQIGGTRSIYFSNGEVVNNAHYSSYIDPTLKELVYH